MLQMHRDLKLPSPDKYSYRQSNCVFVTGSRLLSVVFSKYKLCASVIKCRGKDLLVVYLLEFISNNYRRLSCNEMK